MQLPLAGWMTRSIPKNPEPLVVCMFRICLVRADPDHTNLATDRRNPDKRRLALQTHTYYTGSASEGSRARTIDRSMANSKCASSRRSLGVIDMTHRRIDGNMSSNSNSQTNYCRTPGL